MLLPKAALILLPILWVIVSVWTISGRALIAWPYQAIRDWIWLGLTLFLVFEFAIYVGGYDPDPGNVALAKALTQDRIVSLQDISPNIETIRNIYRLDTDSDDFEEWVTFIRNEAQAYSAAIYDKEPCRARSWKPILSLRSAMTTWRNVSQAHLQIHGPARTCQRLMVLFPNRR